MSYPILYSATETDFTHNGLGILGDCASCEVTEEANGIFELAMAYPMDGIHFEDIADRSIIKARADQFRDPQLFRVYAISKPMSGIVTVLAEHISYDLSGVPVSVFSAPTAFSALVGLKENAAIDCPFEFWTDKETQGNFKVSVPSSIRSRLGGVAGSILDVYGGEYEFDNYTVKLHKNRGKNRGVSIRYGKNLTDIKQEQNCSNVATGVYPYWVSIEGDVLVELPEKIVNAPGTYNFVRVLPIDLSDKFETQPTVEDLRSRAEKYVTDNNIGVPKVSLSVSFVQLNQTEEYKHLNFLDRVDLFDTVNVEFPALGVSATAKVVKMVYDVLDERVKSTTLGSVRSNIADTIAQQGQNIDQTAKKEASRAVKGQTSEDIFDRLTDYGRIQGIYIEDDKWYINAEVAKVVNFIADKVNSFLNNSSVEISGAELSAKWNDYMTASISNMVLDESEEEPENSPWARPIFYLRDLSKRGEIMDSSELTAHHIKVGGSSLESKFKITTHADGTVSLSITENEKEIFWKDNGDGTYTLAGR